MTPDDWIVELRRQKERTKQDSFKSIVEGELYRTQLAQQLADPAWGTAINPSNAMARICVVLSKNIGLKVRIAGRKIVSLDGNFSYSFWPPHHLAQYLR